MAPAAVGLVVTIASAAYTAYAQKQAGDFQAAVAKRNAEAAEKMAQDASARGLNEGIRLSLVGGATRGSIRAGYGASGIDLASGSPLDVLSDAAMFTELNKEAAKSNSDREAFSYRTQSGNFLAQGSIDKTTGMYAAGGTLLTGAGQAYGDYFKATRKPAGYIQ